MGPQILKLNQKLWYSITLSRPIRVQRLSPRFLFKCLQLTLSELQDLNCDPYKILYLGLSSTISSTTAWIFFLEYHPQCLPTGKMQHNSKTTPLLFLNGFEGHKNLSMVPQKTDRNAILSLLMGLAQEDRKLFVMQKPTQQVVTRTGRCREEAANRTI